MTRFSPRYGVVIAVLIGITIVPIVYGRFSPTRDECPSPTAVLDGQAIDPRTEIQTEGPRATDFERGRVLGIVRPRESGDATLMVAVQRTFDLPNRLLSPANILPGRREPDDVHLRRLETDSGGIPVHYAYERRGRSVRLTAYLMTHRGKAIRSPLWTRLAYGVDALLNGRWPITLFAASVQVQPRALAASEELVDAWLRDAWSHYRRVCTSGSAESTSHTRPL